MNYSRNWTPARKHQLEGRLPDRPILRLPPAKLFLHGRLEPLEFRSLTSALAFAYLHPAQYALLTPRGSRVELDTLSSSEGASS